MTRPHDSELGKVYTVFIINVKKSYNLKLKTENFKIKLNILGRKTVLSKIIVSAFGIYLEAQETLKP